MDSSMLQKLLGGASVGSGLYGLFGDHENPADKANQYIGQIPGQTRQYYEPWIQTGQKQLPGLEKQYGDLMGNPGGKFNEIGQNFHESPGFKFALQQALQGSNQQNAAGGMYGSPQNTQQNMQLATDLANQDYYNYMKGATGLYGAGLVGSQGLAGMGQESSKSLADMIAQTLAQQGAYGYEGAAQENQNKSGSIGNILGGLASFLF
jgi:hypothetical protein